MNITYQVEKYADAREAILPLALENFAEGDARNSEAALAINWDMYDSLEEQGFLFLITARDEDELIGYLSLSLVEHPHILGFTQATTDAIYIEPAYRGLSLGKKLLTEAEAALKEVGINWLSVCFRSEEVGRNLMKDLGYEQTDVVYGKSLKGEE